MCLWALRHTRGLGAVLEMEIPKEKIKNLIISFWSSWSQVLKISTHLNFWLMILKISQIYFVYIYSRHPCTSTMWLSPLKVKVEMLTMQGWLGGPQISQEKLKLFVKYLYTMLEASNPYYLNIVNITFTSK